MGVGDVAAERAVGTSGAVVRSLGSGETVDGPAEGGDQIGLEQSVLLFNAVPLNTMKI